MGESVQGSGLEMALLYWFRGRDTRPQGPLSLERLRELWLRGQLEAHSLVWCEAWPHWKPVCLVPELCGPRVRGTPTPPPTPSRRTRPPGDTYPPLLSPETQEAWLRQLEALRTRVQQVVERPTRKLAPVRARHGGWLLAVALAGPAVLGLVLSVLVVALPRPVLPSRLLSLLRAPEASAPRAAPRPPAPSESARAPARPAAREGRVVLASGVLPPPGKPVGQCALPAEVPAFDPSHPAYEALLDKEFERQMGFDEAAPVERLPEAPQPERTVYVPPEPGVVPPESLSTSDILQVVSEHKQSVRACILRYAPQRPEGEEKQRVVVRWSVRPSGHVSAVGVEDEGLRGTPFAHCLEMLVGSWTFPRHRVAAPEPIRFPFVY